MRKLPKLNNLALFTAGLMILLLTGCNEPTTIGSDFFDDDKINVQFTTDFDLITKTIVREPEVTYIDNVTIPNTHLLGQLDDPILGRSVAQLYTQFDFTARKTNPFDSAVIDSVQLILKYDTFGVYGTLEEEVTMRIYELEEDMNEDATYHSDQTFMASSTALTEYTFIPKPYDSIVVMPDSPMLSLSPRLIVDLPVSYVVDNIVPLDTGFWDNSDSFRLEVPGFKIEIEANNTMLGFRMDDIGVTQMKVYYRDTANMDTLTYNFFFDDAIVKTAYYEHDYSAGLAGQLLADSLSGQSDSLLFLQEMQGLSPKIDISGLSLLDGSLINEAVLEFTVAELPNDDVSLFPKVDLLTAETTGDSSIVETRDTELAKGLAAQGGSTLFYINAFGGDCRRRVVDGDTLQTYRTVVTTHIQDLVNMGSDSADVIISSFLRPESPRRVVFYGNNSKSPVKLRVTYTDLK